jgi:DNA repair protein RecO (recombination protein O)
MLHRTEAVILKTTPFSDADLIVTAFTLDYGLVTTFAKSSRKIKSRFGSSLEPLTYAKVSFWGREESTLPRLTQSDIIKPFQSLRERSGYFFRVMEIIELTLGLLAERETNRECFHLLITTLNRIENSGSENGAVFNTILYKIRLLDMVGYGPRLEGCARCGTSGYNFYLSHGSIICGTCAGGMDAPMRLSLGLIRLYESLRKWDISKIDRIKMTGTLLAELSEVLNSHIQYTIAKPLKTKAFLTGPRE